VGRKLRAHRDATKVAVSSVPEQALMAGRTGFF